MLEFFRQIWAQAHGELRVVVGNSRPSPARTTVRQQRQILASLESEVWLSQRDHPKFDKVIATARRAKLIASLGKNIFGDSRNTPIGIQHSMFQWALPGCACPKLGFGFDGAF